MSDKHVVGTCSNCGGDVVVYKALLIVGPFPPPTCVTCGATADVKPIVQTTRPCGGIGIHTPKGIKQSSLWL